MKSKSFKAVSVLVCLFLILSVFAACSPKNPDNDDSNTLSPNESWAGGEIVYEPVTISSVELADLVSEALGDEAKDFNGDLSKLTPNQLQKVEDAAKDKGYTVDKDSSGKPVIKKDNVAVTKVSQDEANDILTRASVKDPSKISKDEYDEISKIADDKGLTAVTNGNGGVDIVRPVTRPATRPATDPNQGGNDTPATPSTPAKDDKTTKKNSGGNAGGNQEAVFTTRKPIVSPAGTTLVRTGSISSGFNKVFSVGKTEIFKADAVTSDDGVVAVGVTYSDNDGKVTGNSNALIVKYDKNGKEKWKSRLVGNDLTSFEDVAVLSDGSIVAVGQTLATNLVPDGAYKMKNTVEGVVSKYSNKGERLWTKMIGGSDGDILYSVAATPDGGFVIGGKSKSHDLDLSGLSNNKTLAFVFKLNGNGDIVNRFAIGGTYHCSFDGLSVASNGDVFGVCINANEDGGFAGIEGVKKARKTSIVFKFSSDLKKVWTKSIYLTGSAELPSVLATNDGGCMIAGQYACSGTSTDGTFADIYNGGNKGTTDGVIIRIGGDSKITWLLPLIGFENDFVTGIAKVPGGYAVSGYTNSTNRDFAIQNLGDKDAYVYVISEYGQTQTISSFAGSGADAARGICSNGSTVYVCGQTASKDGYFKGTNSAESSAAFLCEFKLNAK